MTHLPPKEARFGEPIHLEMTVSVWGAGSGAMDKRYADIVCHYHVVGSQEWSVIRMLPTDVGETKMKVETTLPPFQPSDATGFEYYITMSFDGHSNTIRDNDSPYQVTFVR